MTDSTARDSAQKASVKAQNAKDSSKYPFAEAGLVPLLDQKGSIVESSILARAPKELMTKINKMLEDPIVLNAIPKDVRFAWSAKPESEEVEVYQLYALRATKDGKSALGSGEENIIADAYATNSANTGEVEVSMSMTQQATKVWKNITKKAATNNDFIAIVLDNKVFSAPRVNGEIPNGNSSISGSFSVEEATDLAFDQIFHWGKGDPVVLKRLIQTIRAILPMVENPYHIAILIQQVEDMNIRQLMETQCSCSNESKNSVLLELSKFEKNAQTHIKVLAQKDILNHYKIQQVEKTSEMRELEVKTIDFLETYLQK